MDRDALAAMPEAGPVPGGETATTAKGRSSFRALRSRPFRLYFGGQVVSASGSFLQQTAIGWLVLELTGSPSDLGLVLAASGIPSLPFGLLRVVSTRRREMDRSLRLTYRKRSEISG